MSDLSTWQEGNERYLAAMLAWFRLRLERIIPATPAPTLTASPSTPPAPLSLRERLLRRNTPTTIITSIGALPASSAVSDEAIRQAAEALAQAESIDPPPAAVTLSRRFGLSRFELDLLLLCAAMELDTRIASLCARAQDNPGRPYPTFALALALFDEPAWDAISPERPLRYWRLIEIHQPGTQPLTTSPLRADERIVSFIKGLNYLDDRLDPLIAPLDAAPPVSPSQMEAVELITSRLRSTDGDGPPVIQLVGADSPSKQGVAASVAAAFNIHLYKLPVGLLPTQAAELETLARLWQRESTLLPIALYLDAGDMEPGAPSDGKTPPVNRFIARAGTLIFLDTRDLISSLPRTTVTLDIARPTPPEQRAAWLSALGPDGEELADSLAGQFNLNLGEIDQIIAGIGNETPAAERNDRVWGSCLIRTRPRLDALAQRIDARATWDDIVIPETEALMLRQIAAQVGQRSKVYDEWGFRGKMNRGLGINALFAGESGTGKTMAAEVIANDLRLNLYRIDLSAVVSKYIGETEKNLRRLFDAAEDGGAILFFDEADALFGKRSEVKDSHDRYANIEINYLLQRIESYGGLAILATNMKSALDAAFMRRLRFIISFPFPGQPERREMWRKILPAETPTDGLDFERLAKLNLTGGSISNVAINAAFLAARDNSPVTMPHILSSARAEFRKLDRPASEADFRWAPPGAAV
ncbi:MAG: ATPase central domain protein [Chlorobi bacterium]|nr:ATPase central domain protein [Chlorobiota bacterium]